jgi:hypothetical protein
MQEESKVSICETEPNRQSQNTTFISDTQRIKTEYDTKYSKLLEKYIQEKYTKYEESKN